MSSTLNFIKKRFQLRYRVPMPIVLPIERYKGLPDLFEDLCFKVGVEIGTAAGHYAKWLFARIRGLKLYCVDPWEVYPRYTEMSDTRGQKIYDSMFDQTKKRLAGKNVKFVRKYSMDAIRDFKDESLDFVYIDANHSFEYAINDIAEWERKVKIGGIVSGHDYWNSIKRKRTYNIGLKNKPPTNRIDKMKLCQVKDAIDAWTKTNLIKIWFVTKEINGESRGASWFYIKE